MQSNVWDEITYPFLNFNGYTIEVWEWISNLIPLYQVYNYLSMLWLELNHNKMWALCIILGMYCMTEINSLRPIDAYMRQ